MLRPPLVTEDLVRRLEDADVSFLVEWLQGMPQVRLEQFGQAVAAADPARPELDFVNRVMGLFPEDAGSVGEIVAFYCDLGVRPWFALLPVGDAEALARQLAACGAEQIGFFALLYGVPAQFDPDGRVTEIGPAESEVFAEVRMGGVGVPEGGRAPVARWTEREGFRTYVARENGVPAAAATLVVRNGIGHLADAATLPEYRGRGLQTALIRRRITDAAGAGCDLVSAQATFASSSQNNLERAGLRLACVKSVLRLGTGG